MADASSSACSASNSYSRCHDAFISHRGPDSKDTFATALYRNLADRGVRAFLDKMEMQVGCNITSQLKDAIRGASVHVALFTQNYAQSNWCLDELLLMVEADKSNRATLLPVFLDVTPAHLRWTGQNKSGPYAVALHELQEKRGYGIQKVQNWRNALSYAAGISGLELAKFKGGELELLHEVVQIVVKKVRKPPLFVAKHPTGLQQKVEEFELRVRRDRQKDEQACKVVGIVGSGGVGKTTVAKQFFNANRSIYEGSSFLFDMAKMSLPSLQRNLIKDLKGIDIEIRSSAEGLGQLERNLSNCYSLIVLDDIDNVDQLDFFLPIKDVLHPSSLLLVTTRDKQVLRNADIEEFFIYHLKELDTEYSRELFCFHAFSTPHSPPEFNNIVDRFLKTCGGLPLSLKVLGALLHGKNSISEWQDLLDILGQELPKGLQQSLRVSYDSLNEQEKQIFLDIACFCIGEESDKWIKVWNGSGWKGSAGRLKTLQDKCLVELDTEKENIIRMHDLLVLMGRKIAQERNLPIRIWRGTFREIFDLLEQSLYETIEVRGIRMAPLSNIARDTDHAEEWLKLEELLNSKKEFRIKKLQILEGEGDFVERMLNLRILSSNLISLRWNDCRCSCLPSFSMKYLRVLEVNGRELERLWPEDENWAPQQLLQLNIDAPRLDLPKSLGKLRHLEKIVLKSARLTRMPDPLWDLRDLQHIALVGCENLEILPDSLENLTNLRYLNLSLCKSLRVLPDSMEKLKKLQFINLDSCKKLEKLPHCLLNFPNICCTPAIIYKHHSAIDIDLSGFPCLKMLPDSLRYEKRVKKINLTGCESLKSLPDFLGELTCLADINLRLCKSLEMLPESFGNLKRLHTINLSECESLKRLPDSLGKLTSLRAIHLGLCKSLEMLPESFGNLKRLHIIILSGCESLKRLPDSMGKLTSLVSIHLGLCKSLEMVPDSFENLTSLYAINLSGCESLKRLPDSLGKLTSLRYINLGLCKSLEMLPDSYGNLKDLYAIDLSGCKHLERLPNSWANPLLRHLHLKGCSSLTMLNKTFGNLSALECLDLSGCPQVEFLPPEFERLPFLKKLNLFDTNLKEFAFDVVSFKNLEVLRLGSPLLEVLPASLGYLTKLRQLWLHGCVQLQCLPDSIELLTELTELNIRECGIQCLPPGIMKMNELRTLALHRCPLRELPFGKIEGEKGMLGLNVLQLSGIEICEVSFPEGVCPNLEHLSITFCNDLVEVRALPTTLISLDLKGCRPLMKTAGLCGLANLRKLNMSGCDKLQTEALPGLQTLISSDCTLLNTQVDTSDGKEEDALLEVFCNHLA